jgi:hypothetical protein
MRAPRGQRGFLLIVAVVIIAVAATMAAVIVTLTTGTGAGGALHVASTQALFIAKSGIERALNGLRTNTLCATPPPGAVVFNNVAVGAGTYTVTESFYAPAPTTLSAGILSTDTIIPLVSAAGYAPHGRVQIDFEKIDYTGIAGNSLTGARRGVAGTAAANQLLGASVFQNECLIRSVGNSDVATRTLETAVALPRSTAFLDGAPVAVTFAAPVTIGTLNTGLPAGTNIVLAKISLRNTAATGDPQMSAGSLTLSRGAVTVTNQFVIDVGGVGAPSNSVFPQENQYLMMMDVNAPANAVYTVTAQARTNNNATAEVKLIVINQPPNATFQDGGTVAIGSAAQTTMLTHNSTVPAGDNIILAVAQFDNTSGGPPRSINAGNYRLRRGAAVLASNQFALNLARQARVNQGTAMLLMARDVGAPANPQYIVSAQANNNGINGEVKIVVINGLLSAFLDGGAVAVSGVALTPTGSLVTTFPAGENLVIAATQYENTAGGGGGARDILAGNEQITFGGVAQAVSAFHINLCASGTVECNDFDKGIMWRHAAALQNPTYNVEVMASGAGINGESKIMGIHFDFQVIGEREIFP